MTRVYIAGPISKGNLAANVNQATEAFVRLAKAGLAPFCPHWSVYAKPCRPGLDFHGGADEGMFVVMDDRCECTGTRNGNDEMTHADWMGIDLPWVSVAEAVLRLPGESTGADLEVKEAYARGIPVFHRTEDVIAWWKSVGSWAA